MPLRKELNLEYIGSKNLIFEKYKSRILNPFKNKIFTISVTIYNVLFYNTQNMEVGKSAYVGYSITAIEVEGFKKDYF